MYKKKEKKEREDEKGCSLYNIKEGRPQKISSKKEKEEEREEKKGCGLYNRSNFRKFRLNGAVFTNKDDESAKIIGFSCCQHPDCCGG